MLSKPTFRTINLLDKRQKKLYSDKKKEYFTNNNLYLKKFLLPPDKLAKKFINFIKTVNFERKKK